VSVVVLLISLVMGCPYCMEYWQDGQMHFLMIHGGYDSFILIIPHLNSSKNVCRREILLSNL
jgi:hypothetical protein